MSRVARSSPPPPGPRRPFRFPDFRRERLSNGLELVVAASRCLLHSLPGPVGQSPEEGFAPAPGHPEVGGHRGVSRS